MIKPKILAPKEFITYKRGTTCDNCSNKDASGVNGPHVFSVSTLMWSGIVLVLLCCKKLRICTIIQGEKTH